MSDAPRVLNWGCGHQWGTGPASWVSSDRDDWGQHHVGDILVDQLAYPTGHFDAVVSHHALQALDWHGIRPALRELARVTRPDGYLRMTVPDIVGGFDALGRGDRSYFPVNEDDEPSVDGAFCAWATWFGTNLTVFTRPWLTVLLAETGWDRVSFGNGPGSAVSRTGPVIAPGVTLSPWEELAVLDDRDGESILLEARRVVG